MDDFKNHRTVTIVLVVVEGSAMNVSHTAYQRTQPKKSSAVSSHGLAAWMTKMYVRCQLLSTEFIKTTDLS